MIVPAIPILAVAFEISPGTAAQIVTASGLGRFVGLPIGGAVLDRLGARSALIAGPALACIAGLLAASHSLVRNNPGAGLRDRRRRERLGYG